MKKLHSSCLHFIVYVCLSTTVAAQITVGPGVVNRYYPVTAITPPGTSTCDPTGSPTFTLGASFGSGPSVTATPLAEGNKVLVIQMMAGSSGSINSGSTYKFGSTTTVASTCTYGDVISLGNAGNYEYALISSISGSQITFTLPLLNSYTPLYTQVIPVAGYSTAGTNVITSGVIAPLAWDSTNRVGGVVAIESNGGTLTINGNIDALGMGFKGGPYTIGGQGCCNSGNGALAYACYYNENSALGTFCGAAGEAHLGAPKGSGVFSVIKNEGLGYAHIANGGGGGGGHNSGGGGGGGAAGGGNGGYEYAGCSQSIADNYGGRGGLGLPGNGSTVYMGGGGGSGHGNQLYHTAGANGGGIIMLKASQIIVPAATNVTLDVRGAGALAASKIGNPAADDAAGGGGGGGTVLVQLTTGWSLTGTLAINASGGKGGDNNSNGLCHGTGGGGGGGRIEVSGTNANLTLTAAAGSMGVHLLTTCSPATWGAVSGAAVLPVSSGVTLNQNINCTPLPVTWINFNATKEVNGVKLDWTTATESNSNYFEVEKSFDGINFELIGKVKGNGTSNKSSNYIFYDYSKNSGTVYYRLKQVDLDNHHDYSVIKYVFFESEMLVVIIDNNPTDPNGDILINFNKKGKAAIEIVDILGRIIYSKTSDDIDVNSIPVSKTMLGQGVFFVKGVFENEAFIKKIIVN